MGYDGLGIDFGIDLGVLEGGLRGFEGAYADFGVGGALGEGAVLGGLGKEEVPWGVGEYVMGEARVSRAGDWGLGLGFGCERIEIV